jgi:hypothetical protein
LYRPRALAGRKSSIDYYQREYKWQTKQVTELIDDLADIRGKPKTASRLSGVVHNPRQSGCLGCRGD